ncbi:MAG: DUF2075 domain-containing protein, partial [Bdellovibrionaceae bacterium]|nr:DUF2075 domain-containing protein [Pseudobdellovibrionaceae bacterium]
WKNSLPYMERAIRGIPELPADTGVSIEYQIPLSGKRIDFILTGLNSERKESVIIIELKQWSKVEATLMPSTVKVQWQSGQGLATHPSYQAWSYSKLIQDYNETVQDEEILIGPCAFLHNYVSDGVIDSNFYQEDIERAPLFLKTDIEKLRLFIQKNIKYGDKNNILYRIENGKIRPSKQLADHLVGLMKGNPEFILIDEQKVAYETVLLQLNKDSAKKNVIIIEGGPGTGKTVLAINLLVEATRRGKLAQYVTKNSAPREVYQSKLAGTLKKTQISNLFVGSGAFTDQKKNEFDLLIVDEAHRLNEKSGLFRNQGENQIKELIHAAKNSVFLIDEDQRVTIFDIGKKESITNFAKNENANIIELTLPSQFRCNGSDGYLAWLDNALQVSSTANIDLDSKDYDFRVVDDPNKLYELIKSKNKNNKSRVVAGYCWNWISKNDPNAFDIEFKDFKFKMKWNLAEETMLWILKDDSVDQIGCIHTCQGLEVEYVGVIIGPDLIVRNGKVITNYKARAKTDQSLKGIKKIAKADAQKAEAISDPIIRNTYRTLMTRGSKGCFIFSEDGETRDYFRNLVRSNEEKAYSIPEIRLSKVAEKKKKYGKSKTD